MPTREFIVRLSSPAFLGDVPAPEPKSITYRGQQGTTTDPVPYYPIDPAGLRVPSLRGVLAFWYRSLLGGDSRQIHRRQAEIFGAASRGQGLTLLPLKARFDTPGEVSFRPEDDMYRFLYMGYGPLQYVKLQGGNVVTSHNPRAFRDAVLVPTPAKPRPAFRFLARGTADQLEELDRALKLLHLFGGVGARSRRCWGSVEIEGAGLSTPDAESPEALANHYRAQLAGLWAKGDAPSSRTTAPAHSSFFQGSRALVTPFRKSWKDIVVLFHRRFAQTRLIGRGDTPPEIARSDRDLEQAAATEAAANLTAVPQRLAFGLPYTPESSQVGWRIGYRGVEPNGDPLGTDAKNRRASPLLLKIVRLKNRRHAGVALFFGGQFFGDSSLEIGAFTGRDPEAPKSGTVPVPGYSAVHEFLNESSWQTVPLP